MIGNVHTHKWKLLNWETGSEVDGCVSSDRQHEGCTVPTTGSGRSHPSRPPPWFVPEDGSPCRFRSLRLPGDGGGVGDPFHYQSSPD